MISTIGAPADLLKYEEEHPGHVTNIIDGMTSGRLRFCPADSTRVGRLSLQTKLQTLYAEKRLNDHCNTFLDKAIPRLSRAINRDEIQDLLSGLGRVWSRGSRPSPIGASGKGDAIRVRPSFQFNKFIYSMIYLGPYARNIKSNE